MIGATTTFIIAKNNLRSKTQLKVGTHVASQGELVK